MATRKVIGTINHIINTNWEQRSITFLLDKSTFSSTTFYPKDKHTVLTNDNGYFEIDLWCNAEALEPVEYTCWLPEKKAFKFVLTYDTLPLDIVSLWILNTVPLTPQQVNPLEVLINTHAAVKASATQLGHIKIGSGLSIDSTGIVSASVASNEEVQDAVSTLFTSVAPYTWTYDDTLNKISLVIAEATTSVSGLMSASDKVIFNALAATYQPLNAKLTSISALANGAGWLHNDGSGILAYTIPTAADVGLSNLTSTSLQLGTGGAFSAPVPVVGIHLSTSDVNREYILRVKNDNITSGTNQYSGLGILLGIGGAIGTGSIAFGGLNDAGTFFNHLQFNAGSTPNVSFTAKPILPNNIALVGNFASGGSQNDLLVLNASNDVLVGSSIAPSSGGNTVIRSSIGDIIFRTAVSTERWRVVSGTGHLIAGTDNSYDIGASGATRPRDIFIGGKMVVAAQTATNASVLLTVDGLVELRPTNAAHSAYKTVFTTVQGMSTISSPNNDMTLAPAGKCFFTVNGNGSAGSVFSVSTASNMISGDATDKGLFKATATWAPTNNPCEFQVFRVDATINQTGTATGNYVGFKMLITETAALGSTNLLMDLRVGNVTKFSITPVGGLTAATGTFTSNVTTGPRVLVGGVSSTRMLTTSTVDGNMLFSNSGETGFKTLILGANAAFTTIGATPANGQQIAFAQASELLTIAATATTTTTTLSIPAGVIILSVSVRVTTVIPTATTFTVKVGATTFNTSAVSTAANSTDTGTAAGAFYNSAATQVTITPNATPGAATGVVRITVYYIQIIPPTS